MNEIDLALKLLAAIAPYLGSAAAGGLAVLAIAKRKLHQFREFVDSVDDAATDNSISEQEFQTAWSRFKVLIGREPTPNLR